MRVDVLMMIIILLMNCHLPTSTRTISSLFFFCPFRLRMENHHHHHSLSLFFFFHSPDDFKTHTPLSQECESVLCVCVGWPTLPLFSSLRLLHTTPPILCNRIMHCMKITWCGFFSIIREIGQICLVFFFSPFLLKLIKFVVPSYFWFLNSYECRAKKKTKQTKIYLFASSLFLYFCWEKKWKISLPSTLACNLLIAHARRKYTRLHLSFPSLLSRSKVGHHQLAKIWNVTVARLSFEKRTAELRGDRANKMMDCGECAPLWINLQSVATTCRVRKRKKKKKIEIVGVPSFSS